MTEHGRRSESDGVDEPPAGARPGAAGSAATAPVSSASPVHAGTDPVLSASSSDITEPVPAASSIDATVGTMLEPEQDPGGGERTRVRLVSGRVVPGTRYRLVRWLGEGGMGVVYEAEHVDIERKVALKVLRYDLSRRAEMAAVFRAEARAASRTGHPNIVEIYDFGELPDGRLFICMELLDGKDLVPATESEVRPPAEVLAIFRQLCKALGAAHKAGIVHRDIKPENIILVRKAGRDGVVKVVDFGISAVLGQERRGKIAGTPHYMAPEQIRGLAFDGRLDMYAAGCVAFELLTGSPPFPNEALEEVLNAHVHQPPPSFRQARPDLQLPAALEQVVLRCLSKQPDERYADMHELEAALCEAQIACGMRTAWDDLPLPECAPERLERLRARMPSPQAVPRRWLWPIVAGASLVAAGVAIAVALRTPDPPAAERSRIDALAEEALVAASQTLYVAPPPDQPDVPTAYTKVLELEAIGGPAAGLADARAGELRGQFAAGLVNLGDKYWEVAGARPFAVEYYIWARAFDPDHRRAIERSGMTPGAFTLFQEKARSGSWSLGELQALGLVSALADDDAERRQKRTLVAHQSASQLSISQHLDLDAGLRGAGIELPQKPAAKRSEPEPPPVEPPPQPEPAPVLEDSPAEIADAPPVADVERPKKATLKSNRDPAKAKRLADDGVIALKAGRRNDAESLFHQAIFYDNRNARALMGLSDIYFDTGAKQKAVQFAELAVEAAPQSKSYHLKLGDAYFVVLRYRDALTHYEKARDLGEDGAQGRIDKVKKLIAP
ncbi:serine/threonine-protein kinase [Nannocystis bainbridge]|uniref:Serine/threonine-protein kinase n=1 Tax=Nannocystis bainbridge TaxID=2995303 RepID=A0ABT5E973_9BACT|nr:serine/threonine-protein kinase [Nannocystis bainbridge]MDC0722404.1 serine/threonine-protein kinase [Nannocystis bainbridge]